MRFTPTVDPARCGADRLLVWVMDDNGGTFYGIPRSGASASRCRSTYWSAFASAASISAATSAAPAIPRGSLPFGQ